MIFNIQRYATHDGPGIRTVVFLKGCSLSCTWCQNPESRSRTIDMLYDERLCLKGCLRCTHVASGFKRPDPTVAIEIDRKILTEQEMRDAADVCPSGAISICGEQSNTDKIMAEVLKDKAFYSNSGGGMTISGGEPFMQHNLAYALFHRAKKEHIHTAVESCLHVPWPYIEPSVDSIDLWLVDLKHVDEEIFQKWTNGQLSLINKNLEKLGEHNANIIFRVPIITGFNDNEETIKAIIKKAADHYSKYGGSGEIHFLPYHTYGVHKYHLLGIIYDGSKQPLDRPELLAFAEQEAKALGLTAILRG
jgi:pyruvate formate lyase activating enzyme|nr:glycyl-radical enzyme activating protein [uncultured Tolumonas sp.]